ncbi:MAG: O-antigen ligase family protein [Opitutus sp.]
MSLTPIWRNRFIAVGAGLLAVWLGGHIALQQFFWPALFAVGLVLVALARWQPLPLSTVLLGAGLFGYVVGNRGFAQIMLIPHQPLLPAEAILATCGALLLVQCAWRHELPFRRDVLNALVLLWLLVGSARVAFDFREFGLIAVRDFALVYYAAFFFLGQEVARAPEGRRFLERTLFVSCTALVVTNVLFERFPDFFVSTLTFRGNPLIYYKGDLVGTFLAIGAVLAFVRSEKSRRIGYLLLSVLLAGAVISTNNRASMLGLFVATTWLALGGRWKFFAAQAVAGVVAAVVVLAAASVLNISLERTPLLGIYERVVSLTDPTGQRSYQGEGTFNKGDNNLFRTVWWRTVLSETVQTNPYVGLGFGHDLADRFVREYYPESGEEFSVRSPHNVLVTVFARMGAVGLAVLAALLLAAAARTWQAVRMNPDVAAPWCIAWVLFSSACFGVVLEGPMGAIVFWTSLGWAHAALAAEGAVESPTITEKGQAAALPLPAASV